jgi:hypothetical protein
MLDDKTRVKAEQRIKHDYRMTSWKDTYHQAEKAISEL